MLLKVLAALLFITAGAAAGSAGAEKLRRDTEVCRSIGILLRRISALIRSTGMDVYKLSAELKRSGSFDNLGFIRELPESFSPDENFHSVWRKAVESEKLHSEEKQILLCLGDELGNSDICGQLSVLASLEEEIASAEKLRTEESHKKGKLYRSVGMLFGVMAGVLII